eukprot:TRINITY_DN2095_c0_g3_i1.p1 TRINITY_DN2095_c0_g3~~TRINITY_DN2095_c0_g3_i1.p1  ORF type:complete len:169 (-),score=30.29 TRINITY_DN2095_c0_g3_i1:658-1164(-)
MLDIACIYWDMATLQILARPWSNPQVGIACCSSQSKQLAVLAFSREKGSFSAASVSSQPSLSRLRGRTLTIVNATGKNSSDGDSTSKAILDAFFLGKALAETVNERIGTTLGEILSEIGKQQAEQREQVRQFQEEVKERAEVAKQKAARAAKADDLSAAPKRDDISIE